MKVFSVFGITQSGKTTTIENIIRELKRRGYSVGSVKEIHYEKFAIDTEGSNTDRHRKAGSELVTARGYHETDVLFPDMLPVKDILKFYNTDFVVLEGVSDFNVPKIITAHTTSEVDERMDGSIFALSGKLSNSMDEYRGLPVINSMDNIEKLVDLIEKKVYEVLPDFPSECCSACGYSCEELGMKILKGEARREDCTIHKGDVKLRIDGKNIDMVPFVKKILFNGVQGVVRELEGYREGSKIEIEIGGKL